MSCKRAITMAGIGFLLILAAGACVPAGALGAAAKAAPIRYEGGSGDSPDTPVIIRGASNSVAGIDAEYHYLGQRFGQQNVDWRLIKQELVNHGDKILDEISLKISHDGKRIIYFDITEFSGKL
jgi:hypothetical protein